jgi:hypothetical protein
VYRRFTKAAKKGRIAMKFVTIAFVFLLLGAAVGSQIVMAEQLAYPEPFVPMTTADRTIVRASGGTLTDDCNEAGCAGALEQGCACPTLVGRVNAVYLWRDKPDSTDIFSSPNGAVLLNASDFDFSPRAGIDATLTYYRNCDTGFDVRYLWLDDYNANVAFTVPVGTSLLNTTPNSLFIGSGFPADFRYLSKLQTVEVNLRKKLQRFDLLLGFRYADFHESLEGTYTSGALTETETWSADRNSLYGFQTGAEAVLWKSCSGAIRIDGFGKAGIYYNDIHTNFETRFFQSFDNPVTASAGTSQAAFLGELGINGAYQMTEHLSLRAGYQVLWLSGVATAGQQVPATANFNGSGGRTIASSVDSGSSIFYHGFNVGVEVAW